MENAKSFFSTLPSKSIEIKPKFKSGIRIAKKWGLPKMVAKKRMAFKIAFIIGQKNAN